MPESKSSSSSPRSPLNSRTRPCRLLPLFFAAILLPVVAAIVVYQLDSFDAAPMPLHELSVTFEPPLLHNDRMLQGAEYLGAGKLSGPEDFAYDSRSQVIYTGTVDGWIKRVWLNDSGSETVVEDWVNTGGRPLGLALGLNQEIIVADAYKVWFLFCYFTRTQLLYTFFIRPCSSSEKHLLCLKIKINNLAKLLSNLLKLVFLTFKIFKIMFI